MSFTVRDGRILRDGVPFVPIGCNYHPSRAGCRIWLDWNPHELDRDFRQMAEDGLNTVRLFVFWRDFEPEPGGFRMASFARLRDTVELADRAGLVCVLSIFTIWMNGQRLDLPWRAGRSLWRDPALLARQEEFLRAIGRTLDGADNVLAFDLGDEIANVEPGAAAELSAADVAGWHDRMAAALRAERPGALVCQANDASGVFGSTPFGVDNARGLDLIATHGFPTWAPGSIESTRSYKATSLAPFLVRFAAAYGTPFVDELGSYGVDDETAARYLRASAASILANGGAGLAVWCWQDIVSAADPYRQRPNERYQGLRRIDGTPKPILTELRRVAAAAADLSRERGRARIALYLPQAIRGGSESYLDGQSGTVATFFAYLLLKRAHLDFDVVSGSLDGYRLVVCPSVTRTTETDRTRLRACLDGGGFVYYSMGDHLHGFPGADLAGVELVDYSLRAAGKSALAWTGDEWPLDWATAAARPVQVAAKNAVPLGHFPDGDAALFANPVGRGRMIFCAAPFERQLDQPDRLTAERGERFYRRIAEFAGLAPVIGCAEADVEIVPERSPTPSRAIVVNHRDAPVRAELIWAGNAVPIELAAKDWRIVERGTP
ncbi:cellulase family glycosylhydrolase [Amycolatopsis anabasis]|uniref:cellulase family glycosylhydrolase n=1 Tax=Amycolatopsis anabasis TaxID=1840409 RepID=UPI00131E7DEF|nr:cellulase family glycosylhydrolase [Amycolatopsis anabasis]